MTDVHHDSAAHAVLLPVVSDLVVGSLLDALLVAGTRTVLIAETREEYVARSMSNSRRDSETRDDIAEFAAAVRAAAAAPMLVALDQEPWGIQRLHDLVHGFPPASELTAMDDGDIVRISASVGEGARDLGVNVFLSPVLDVLTGDNPWLEGRTLALEPAEVARIAGAFIRGVQAAGVVAVAKHFPGYPQLVEDPALRDTFVAAHHTTTADLLPFIEAVRVGVKAIMTGPAVVAAVDSVQPSSTSQPTVGLLRDDLGFTGLVVSDDLDAPSTIKGRSVTETAIASIAAGNDLLLVGGHEGARVASALAREATRDEVFAQRLHEAADRVIALANETDRGTKP